jgi:hypothetical protein
VQSVNVDVDGVVYKSTVSKSTFAFRYREEFKQPFPPIYQPSTTKAVRGMLDGMINHVKKHTL